ncbi:hypothetical protein QBC37DRAFT_373286 [Rhypophila decipiens]|uniref:Uncharacterized protein n=1 Tax=Rhypophila decipiens TaxID=261697 RepID=A0AAN6Y8L5_9PEZI|nr:hypothetical protein QBC37DRAFT_373286 [Rhypophila decipiens]
MTPIRDTTIDPKGDLWVSLAYRYYEPEPDTRSSADPPTSPEEPETFDSLSQAETEETTKVLVKVSSNVLIQASPVFNIMLTGWAKEASDFASAKAAGEIYTLDLPEDDAVAGILLFDCLHHGQFGLRAPNDRRLTPPTDDLEELAIMCDKYKCKLGPRGLDWIQTKFDDLTDPVRRGRIYPSTNKTEMDQDIQALSRLLVLSYVFEHPEMFSKLAWELFLWYDEPLGTENGPTELLREHLLFGADNVVGYLNQRRHDIYRNVLVYISSRVGGYANPGVWPTDGPHPSVATIAELSKYNDPEDIPPSPSGLSFRYLPGEGDPVAEEQSLAIFSQRSGLRPFIAISSLHRFLNFLGKLNCPQTLERRLKMKLKHVAERIETRRVNFGCLHCLKTGMVCSRHLPDIDVFYEISLL